MQAVMQHSQLQAANLYGANLFAVDLSRIEVDKDTRFDEPYMGMVRSLFK